MVQMQEDEAICSERRDLQRLQLDQVYATVRPSAVHRPATPRDITSAGEGVASQPTSTQNTTSSSPVSSAGKEDTCQTVKDFFKWLIAQQPAEDRGPYEAAQRVVIEEMWTIKDLKDMAKLKSDLHDLAVNRYKLKDGVVRHFKEELRHFKSVYRTASSLVEIGTNLGTESR
ncbi:uncharacterized protein EI97DRAFT_500600 [Westerdykella ornata]|uniref:Uncharacterized protein n=1 Tax=Westerdykella ornata TaxID=318751 RepID=A0A6A6JKD1_WESOR|nr:uncharacterized protein EI97DRAFT_500600 [Westerdykella ornata]KAF2276932.1 hypothetical protein EI97DRAFT_500600 [Westerdykella ornata]